MQIKKIHKLKIHVKKKQSRVIGYSLLLSWDMFANTITKYAVKSACTWLLSSTTPSLNVPLATVTPSSVQIKSPLIPQKNFFNYTCGILGVPVTILEHRLSGYWWKALHFMFTLYIRYPSCNVWDHILDGFGCMLFIFPFILFVALPGKFREVCYIKQITNFNKLKYRKKTELFPCYSFWSSNTSTNHTDSDLSKFWFFSGFLNQLISQSSAIIFFEVNRDNRVCSFFLYGCTKNELKWLLGWPVTEGERMSWNKIRNVLEIIRYIFALSYLYDCVENVRTVKENRYQN